jgi:4-amino-4-deoxychorismate lyase
MSDQGEIPDRDPGFSLIETLLWTRDAGFQRFDRHLRRLARSCAALGFAFDEARARAALAAVVAETPGARLRARLEWSAGGEAKAGATTIEPVPDDALWRVIVAERRLSSADPLLAHKTTRREIYDSEFARAGAMGAEETLLLNERGEVCEAARMNVFLPRDGVLLTPPLASGLLPGVLREELIEQGRAREAVLQLEDFGEAGVFFVGNSLRGLVWARVWG